MSEFSQEWERLQKPAVPPSWPAPVEFNQFIARPVEKPKPLVDNLLDASSRLVIGGGSKTFKSWLMSELAICIACGQPWWDFITHHHPVLYCNFELQEFYFKARLLSIRNSKGWAVPPDFLHLWNLRDVRITLLEFKAELISRIQTDRIVAVFIDPFYKLLGDRDERISSELAPLLESFGDISRVTGASIICAAHFSKGNQASKDPMDRISGGASINRFPDGLLTLTRHETDGAFTVDITCRDFPPIEPFVVEWKHPTLRRTGSLDPAKLRAQVGRKKIFSNENILEILKEHDDELSTSELQKLLKEETGMSVAAFYRFLAELKETKKVFKSKASDKWNLGRV